MDFKYLKTLKLYIVILFPKMNKDIKLRIKFKQGVYSNTYMAE